MICIIFLEMLGFGMSAALLHIYKVEVDGCEIHEDYSNF